MRDVAREMNLSETAFLVPKEDGFNLRWLTRLWKWSCADTRRWPAHTFCGDRRAQAGEQARFHTLSGLLTAERKGDWIELDFPAKPEEPAKPWDELVTGLGISPRYVGKSQFDYLVEADSERAVRSLNPDFTLLRRTKARGVIVTRAPRRENSTSFPVSRAGLGSG